MWSEPNATDNSGINPTWNATHSPGDRFTLGSTDVTYTFWDWSLNEANCTFTVTVTGA